MSTETMEAISACVDNTAVSLDDKYIVLVLLLLFYITTQQSYTLINKTETCSELINQNLYSDFISSFIFWIISFILIIIIKYYGVNTINSFVFNEVENNIKPRSPGKPTEAPLSSVEVFKKKWSNTNIQGVVLRSKYVGQSLLSIVTNILNVAYVILILLTLYKIIDKLSELVECKSEICNKNNLCKEFEGDAEYYKDGKCYDGNKKPITKKKEKPVLSHKGEYTKKTTNSSGTYRLEEDFNPPLIKYFLETWTPIGENTFFKYVGFYITIVILTLFLILYVIRGASDRNYFITGVVIIITGNVILNSVVMLLRALGGGATYKDETGKVISGSGDRSGGEAVVIGPWDSLFKKITISIMVFIFLGGIIKIYKDHSLLK